MQRGGVEWADVNGAEAVGRQGSSKLTEEDAVESGATR